MRHRVGTYLHPWDLRWLADRGGMTALRELGFGDVAFPASYHAGTWTTPVGSGSLVRHLEDGIVYFDPQADYGDLAPLPCAEMREGGPSPLATCIAAAGEAGLESHAWTVLFHNTRLGRLHPECCVENAVGDRYEYSLCPARPEVQAYGVAMVADVAAQPGLDVVEVEAMGYMGYSHGGHHVKRSFAADPCLDFLLSFCFCDACQHGLAGLGVDAQEMRAAVVKQLRERLVEGDAMAPEKLSWQESFDRLAEVLGRKPFLAMIRHRTMVYVSLLSKLRLAMPEGVRLSVHLNMDPLFSGSQIGQPFHSIASMVDEILVTHYGQSPSKMTEMWRGQRDVGEHTRIAIWPKAPEFKEDKDVVAVMNLLENAGLEGLRVYHLGLLPWRTVERVMRVLRA